MGRILAVIGLVVASAIGLAACEQDPQSRPLRIGTNPWPGYAYLFVGQENGLFEEAGLNVELVEFIALSDVRRSFERGQIDGMTVTLAEAVSTYDAGVRDPRIVLFADFSNGADMLVGHKSIRSVADLKGKVVGIEQAGLDRYFLHRALEEHGLTDDDVIVSYMGQGSMLAALDAGKVSAVFVYPPTAHDVLDRDDTHVLFTSAKLPGEVLDVVVFDAKVVEDRSKEIAKLVGLWGEILQFAADNPAKANTQLAAFAGSDVEALSSDLEGIRVMSLEEQRQLLISGDAIERAIAGMSHVLRDSDTDLPALSVSDLVEPRFILEATNP